MMDKVRNQMIGNKKYSFKMTNRTIRKIDEKYGSYATVLYGLMEGEKFYTNSLKLVSMACIDKVEDKKNKLVEKEWSIEELENIISAEQYQDITSLAMELYLDYMGLNDEYDEIEKKEDTKGKN